MCQVLKAGIQQQLRWKNSTKKGELQPEALTSERWGRPVIHVVELPNRRRLGAHGAKGEGLEIRNQSIS